MKLLKKVREKMNENGQCSGNVQTFKRQKKNNQERKKKNIAICDIKNSKGTNIRV